MFRELNYKSPHIETEGKETKRSKKMLDDCEKVIKELQSELKYALQQNQEKDQIIKLLTEEKDYYEQECRKNDEKFYPKLKDQMSFNQSLVNGLKQYNKELTEKNAILEQENKDLWEKCKQKDQILQITEQNIVKLQQEKTKLQREWGETLKCVKKKIFEIQQQNFDAQNFEIQGGKKRAVSKGFQKKSGNQKQQRRKYSFNQQGPRIDSKVQEVLKEIDKKLLNYDFLDMIQSKELRKQVKNFDISQTNKENLTDNVNFRVLDKNQLKGKKVPILKLSELNLNQISL